MELEAGRAQQAQRLPHGGYIVAALVERQDFVVQALHADLHLGHAQPAQMAYLLRRDPVGPRLDHQADVAVRGAAR